MVAGVGLTACTTGGAQRPHAPPFAVAPYEAFSPANVVAIALREWRLFGQPIDDDPPGTHPPPLPDEKPEREPGLWQRVGEYWWMGLPPNAAESGWTGKHDATGSEFPANEDGRYAWSAAFVSYVMRIAGAGPRFPYAPDHARYINVAAAEARGGATDWIIHAERPEAYPPAPGDLICMGRGEAAHIRFDDLPAGLFPAHCDVVVDTAIPRQIAVVGGNVGDAVTMKHVPVTAEGMLATPDGIVLDTRYPWMIVLRVNPIGMQPVT
jgi:hypothetical protein